MKSDKIKSKFSRITAMVYEGAGKQQIADEVIKLEFLVLDTLKKQRDDVRKGVHDIREAYRPIRKQVDEVSAKCDNVENVLGK
jgi:uncharacterized coiled-coil DUF342 family protein